MKGSAQTASADLKVWDTIGHWQFLCLPTLLSSVFFCLQKKWYKHWPSLANAEGLKSKQVACWFVACFLQNIFSLIVRMFDLCDFNICVELLNWWNCLAIFDVLGLFERFSLIRMSERFLSLKRRKLYESGDALNFCICAYGRCTYGAYGLFDVYIGQGGVLGVNGAAAAGSCEMWKKLSNQRCQAIHAEVTSSIDSTTQTTQHILQIDKRIWIWI